MDDRVKSIGFRVEPSRFHWAVVSGTKATPKFEDANTYDYPLGESEAEALSSCRRETSDICERHRPAHAWVRAAEHTIGKRLLLMKRCRGEGVIMATLGVLGLRVAIGPLGSITASVSVEAEKKVKKKKGEKGKTTKTSVKTFLEADEFRGIDWSGHEMNVREAILAAISGLPV